MDVEPQQPVRKFLPTKNAFLFPRTPPEMLDLFFCLFNAVAPFYRQFFRTFFISVHFLRISKAPTRSTIFHSIPRFSACLRSNRQTVDSLGSSILLDVPLTRLETRLKPFPQKAHRSSCSNGGGASISVPRYFLRYQLRSAFCR